MNCTQWEQWILLDHSGELSPRRHRKLQAHLANCPNCTAFAATIPTLCNLQTHDEANLELSDFTRYRIEQAARDQLSRSPNGRIRHRHPVLQSTGLLSALAALLLILGGLHYQRLYTPPSIENTFSTAPDVTETDCEQLAWSDDWDSELYEMELAFAIVDEELSDPTLYMETEETESIARQLLEMEET